MNKANWRESEIQNTKKRKVASEPESGIEPKQEILEDEPTFDLPVVDVKAEIELEEASEPLGLTGSSGKF